MSFEKIMVDSATGASPPRSLTRDIGCSPFRSRSSIQSTARLEQDFDSSSIVGNQKEQNKTESVTMNKFYGINQTSSLSLPSSCSSSVHTTPILGSSSTDQPIALMSLDATDRYDFRAAQPSFKTHTHRWWPVNRRSGHRHDFQYHRSNQYGRRRGCRGDARHHAVKNQNDCCGRNTIFTTGDCDYYGTTSSRQCCKSHCRCI